MTKTEFTICCWIPNCWGDTPARSLCQNISEKDVDVFLVPEGHDNHENTEKWKSVAKKTETTVYVGLEGDEGEQYGAVITPDGVQNVYQKHTTADRLAFEESDWSPKNYLSTTNISSVTVGTTVCHDHYLSPLMRFQSMNDSPVLLNISATPVKRRKWAEILQARAIENASFTVCTTHGTTFDGEKHPTNQAHVFAFDPYGDPVTVTDISTGEESHIFDTEPENAYHFTIDTSESRKAKQSLTNPDDRPQIERVRQTSTDNVPQRSTTISVLQSGQRLTAAHPTASEDTLLEHKNSFSVGGTQYTCIRIGTDTLRQPMELYDTINEAGNPQNPIIVVDSSTTGENYRRSVIDPVARARVVELCSPVIINAPDTLYAFQLANTSKATHRVDSSPPELELNRAWGLTSALKPADGDHSSLLEVVTA